MLPTDVDRYKVIDTDTHVIEPYDLWTSRLSVAKWGDRVPHVKWDEQFQEDAWYFGDSRVGPGASAAQAGWHQYPPDHPPSLDVVDPATWDARARLARMDEHGVWAEVLYPNVAGFGAGKVLTIGDAGLMLACVQAYNDFLAEYASTDPRRYVPIMALPMWDVDLCRAEIARGAELGHKGVIMTGEPAFWSLPKLADPHWDPLWATLQDAGLSVNFHIGSGDMSVFDQAYDARRAARELRRLRRPVRDGQRPGHRQPDHRRRLPPLSRPEVRLSGEWYRVDPVRPRASGLAVEELRGARRTPRV